MTPQLIVTIILGVLAYIVMGIVFLSKLNTAVEVLKTTIDDYKTNSNEKFIQLDKKQDKYNNYLERLIKNEQSTASAHKRIDELKRG